MAVLVIARWMFWKFKRRLACHGTKDCCQKVDKPMCNSWKDPHLDARWRFQRGERLHMKG